MRVLFFTQSDEICAASRTRVYQYLPFLRAQGIEYKVIPMARGLIYKGALILSENRIKKLLYFLISLILNYIKSFQMLVLARHYDVIFIQRVLIPRILLRFLKKINDNIVFDFDDAIYAIESPQANLINRLRANRNRDHLPAIFTISKAVIVENEYNKRFAEQFAHDVYIITGPIDTQRYAPKNSNLPKKSNDDIIIGWIGSSSTSAYLNLLKNVLRALSEKYKITLKLIGASDFDIPGVKIVKRKWDLSTEVSELQSFDIGIMSLPDDEWTRGKGGYKLLQYLSTGIPVVSSPVGINTEIVQEGINGYFAGSEEEWIEKLSILIENQDLREKLGRNGRINMQERYSFQVSAPKFIGILERVCQKEA